MIIYHQNNVAAYAGNHVFYALPFTRLYAFNRISKTSASGGGGGGSGNSKLVNGGLVS